MTAVRTQCMPTHTSSRDLKMLCRRRRVAVWCRASPTRVHAGPSDSVMPGTITTQQGKSIHRTFVASICITTHSQPERTPGAQSSYPCFISNRSHFHFVALSIWPGTWHVMRMAMCYRCGLPIVSKIHAVSDNFSVSTLCTVVFCLYLCCYGFSCVYCISFRGHSSAHCDLP